MTNLGDLLSDLERDGFRLFVRDGELVVAPTADLPDSTRRSIRNHRERLIGLLRDRALGFHEPPARCPVCGGVNFYQRLEVGTWGCLSCFPDAARSAAVLHFGPVPHIPQGSKVAAA